ncbi:MAG: hypothetical protein ACLFTE_06095 [Salinivenus sp.]
MNDDPSDQLHPIRAECRARLRTARDEAAAQVKELGLADLRALRETLQEELDAVAASLPSPGPLEAKGPMRTDAQAEYVERALRYNALRVRHQLVSHELRRRALGSTAGAPTASVPTKTKRLAALAWEVMGEGHVDSPTGVYREVADRADEDLHLTTVEKWLRHENPYHPEEGDERWPVLRRAVLLASA